MEIRLQNEMQSPGGGGEVLAGVSGEAEALTGISTALLAGGGRWSRMAGEMPRASMAGGVGVPQSPLVQAVLLPFTS